MKDISIFILFRLFTIKITHKGLFVGYNIDNDNIQGKQNTRNALGHATRVNKSERSISNSIVHAIIVASVTPDTSVADKE